VNQIASLLFAWEVAEFPRLDPAWGQRTGRPPWTKSGFDNDAINV
jgi:hypothetical protein